MEFYGISKESHGILWNAMGIASHSIEFYWNRMEFNRNPWNSKEFNGNLWHSTGISWNLIEFHGIARNSIDTICNSIEFDVNRLEFN